MNQWSDLEKWLHTTNFEKSMEVFKDIPVISQFFNTMKQNSKPEDRQTMAQDYKFKEGKEHLDVIYNIPKDTEYHQIRLFVREDYVKIEGLPDDTIELIKLPKLVKPKHCKAKIVAGELHIRLAKRPRARKFFEHGIQN